jgi:hypothetical protein
MKLETPVIAVIVAGLMFLGLFGFFTSLAIKTNTDFDVSVYTSLNGNVELENAFNRLNESQNNINNIVEKYNNASLKDPSSLFSFAVIAKDAGSTILGTIGSMKDMLIISSNIIGIPAEIIFGVIAITLIIILLTLLYILIGR